MEYQEKLLAEHKARPKNLWDVKVINTSEEEEANDKPGEHNSKKPMDNSGIALLAEGFEQYEEEMKRSEALEEEARQEKKRMLQDLKRNDPEEYQKHLDREERLN